MQRGNLYKHKNCTDTAFFCDWILYIPEKKGYKVKGNWWNISAPDSDPWPMGITDKFFISAEQIKEWALYETF